MTQCQREGSGEIWACLLQLWWLVLRPLASQGPGIFQSTFHFPEHLLGIFLKKDAQHFQSGFIPSPEFSHPATSSCLTDLDFHTWAYSHEWIKPFIERHFGLVTWGIQTYTLLWGNTLEWRCLCMQMWICMHVGVWNARLRYGVGGCSCAEVNGHVTGKYVLL